MPEIDNEIYNFRQEVLSDGTTVQHVEVRQFVPRPTNSEEILWFVDTDGRMMRVAYTDSGPAKCEMRV